MNDSAPRYMSPTLAQKNKIKSQRNHDETGPINLTQELRKQDITSKGHKAAWRPQNNKVNVDCFDKMTPAPKL